MGGCAQHAHQCPSVMKVFLILDTTLSSSAQFERLIRLGGLVLIINDTALLMRILKIMF